MLVLTRRVGETIRIGDDIFVTVLESNSANSARIGIKAPRDVEILRTELDDRAREQARVAD
ncbi:MAG: carbon storage regulator [Pseudomonadales bacterium]|nr:carbon storage regulator [Pseudomonadales bacterium]